MARVAPTPAGPPKILPLAPVSNRFDDASRAESEYVRQEIRTAGRVIIEIVGVCQAKCPYCAQNSGKDRRREKPMAFMAPELFRKIVSHLSQSESFIKRKVDRIYLYNWGEPFLAPSINEYLEILREHDLFAVISSNFQRVPEIKKENLPVINEVLFSLSGMTDETYGRIHGGPTRVVFDNFEAFWSDLKRYSPRSKVFMSWHRYTFNEHEFWKAYGYSRRQGIGFIPSVAFLNDLIELIQAAGGRLPADRKQDAQRDLFFDHMVDSIVQYQDGGSDYTCPAWDDVVVDETGRLLICCGTDANSAVGNVFDTTYDEMRQRKIQSGLCKACKEKGVAEWAHNNFHDRNQLPWPAGGGIDRLRLKLTYNKLKVKSDIRHVLNNVVFGDAVLGIYRKLKYS